MLAGRWKSVYNYKLCSQIRSILSANGCNPTIWSNRDPQWVLVISSWFRWTHHCLLQTLQVLSGLLPSVLHHPEEKQQQYLKCELIHMLQCCQYKMNTDIKQMLYVRSVSAKEMSMVLNGIWPSAWAKWTNFMCKSTASMCLLCDTICMCVCETYVSSCSLRLFSWSVDLSFSCSTLSLSCSSMIFWFRLEEKTQRHDYMNLLTENVCLSELSLHLNITETLLSL